MADATVVANQTLLGQAVKNVLVFSNLVNDPALLQTFADNFRALWSSGIAAIQSDNWSMDNITVVFNDAPPIYSVTVDFTAGVLVGGSSADPSPTQVCCLVSTQYVGAPPNRGRVYFAGTHEGQINNGLFTVAAYGAYEAFVQDLIDGVDIGEGKAYLRIARRSAAGIITQSNPAEIAVGRDIPAIQRKRRLGSGS